MTQAELDALRDAGKRGDLTITSALFFALLDTVTVEPVADEAGPPPVDDPATYTVGRTTYESAEEGHDALIALMTSIDAPEEAIAGARTARATTWEVEREREPDDVDPREEEAADVRSLSEPTRAR